MNKRHRQHQAADAEAREIEMGLQRLDPRRVADGGLEDQRPEHHQKRQRQKRDRADQHVADRFQPQQPKAALFPQPVSAIEADAQAFDAARSEIDGKHRAERQNAAACGRQHVVDLAGDRAGHLVGPRREHQPRDFVGEIAGADEAGDSAVTTIRNGNTAIKIDSAMWLAIAQPSSRLKR